MGSYSPLKPAGDDKYRLGLEDPFVAAFAGFEKIEGKYLIRS
jgi:hypothetical protein